MKVTGSGGASQTGQTKGARPASSGSVFTPIMPGAVSETGNVASARSVTAVSSLDALLALQDVGGPLERRRRAVSRAGRLLDSLDEIKLAVLDGAVTPAILERLARGVREQREATDDPRLEGLLSEIEMRAGVELAKLEMSRGAT